MLERRRRRKSERGRKTACHVRRSKANKRLRRGKGIATMRQVLLNESNYLNWYYVLKKRKKSLLQQDLVITFIFAPS